MALDQNQIEVLKSDSDKLIVLAGAGSGKTTTMIGRIMKAVGDEVAEQSLPEDVILESIDPAKIQAISFTNVASETLEKRIKHVGGESYKDVNVSTLDVLSLNIIKARYKNAVVTTDAITTAKELYRHYKNTHLSFYNSEQSYLEDINRGLQKYADRDDRARKQFIYDDLLNTYSSDILRDIDVNDEISIPIEIIYHVAVQTMLIHEFIPDIDLLIVDEVQDTSNEQFILLHFLITQLKDLKFVGIGDLSQSMYRWNGAKPQHITQFIDDFNADVKTLPNNYRSHPEIINLANKFLETNLDNVSNIQLEAKSKVNFDTRIEDDERVKYFLTLQEIVEDILIKKAKGVKNSDIAIVSRANSGITEFKDVVENYESGTAKKLKFNFTKYTKARKIQFQEARIRVLRIKISEVDGIPDTCEAKENFIKSLEFTLDKYKIYGDKEYERFRKRKLQEILNHSNNFEDDIKEFIFKDVRSQQNYLDKLLFSTNVENKDEILVTTVHGVKGEEFKYVYYLPTIKKTRIDKGIEVPEGLPLKDKEMLYGMLSEEQNIHYVATTRAIEQLIIVHPAIDVIKDLIDERKSKDLSYNKDIETLVSRRD